MIVKLIGCGCGEGQLTNDAKTALAEAELIIGAPRVLALLPPHDADPVAAYQPKEICGLLLERRADNACVVFSGDSGFYSGARGLLPMLVENGIEAEVLPGISSVQMLSAKLCMPWQEWKLCSAHGVLCDPVAEIMSGRPCFFLTGGTETPQSICKALTDAGLGDLAVWVGEQLGTAEEVISRGTAAAFAEKRFASLSVLLTAAAPRFIRTVPGIPDEMFLRGKVPMTKREVRAAILSQLQPGPGDVCWDIGAGTGSVSVELALNSSSVWALERDPEALELIRKNREKFCAWNLRIIEAEAPLCTETLPKPGCVFVGGSGGRLDDIINAAFAANPKVRICVSAIALETLSRAVSSLERHGCSVEVMQLAVSRSKPAGGLHLLMAQNPVFLITGTTP